MAMSSEPSVSKAVLLSLCKGFVAGLLMELWVRAFVMLGFLSESFRGFVLIIFWCIYSTYVYYTGTVNRFLHDVIVSFGFAVFFGAITKLSLSLQGYEFTAPPFWVFGSSLLLSWAMRFSVRHARKRNQRA